MTDEKWQEILDKVRAGFDLEEEFNGQLENLPNATFEGIIFEAPMGKFKVVRTKRPKVVDKKTQFSGRIGGAVKVDYQYSDNEFVDDLEVFKWSDLANDWQKSDLEL